jgi:hypothetical protein
MLEFHNELPDHLFQKLGVMSFNFILKLHCKDCFNVRYRPRG